MAITTSLLIVGFVSVEIMGLSYSPKWEITFLYLVFISALLITEVQKKQQKVWGLLLALALLVPFATSRYYIILAFFLITIIHVFFFTGAFIFYGALNERFRCSLSGRFPFMRVKFLRFCPNWAWCGRLRQGQLSLL